MSLLGENHVICYKNNMAQKPKFGLGFLLIGCPGHWILPQRGIYAIHYIVGLFSSSIFKKSSLLMYNLQ